MRGADRGRKERWRLLFSASAAAALLGCAQRAPAPPPRTLNQGPAFGAIGFGEHGGKEHFFPAQTPPSDAWLSASTIALPEGIGSVARATSMGGATQRPTVFLMRGSTTSKPAIVLSVLDVSGDTPRVLGAAAERATSPCVGASWLTAFFVDGIGERPVAPVVVEYAMNGVAHRVTADPRKDLVHVQPSLRMAHETIFGASGGPRGYIALYLASITKTPVIPIFARRSGTRWTAEPGIHTKGDYFTKVMLTGDDPRIDEWRIFALALPPGCG